jgi:heparanase
MNKGRSGALRAGATIGALIAAVRCASPASAAPASVAPDTLPRIATVDERYQSYNVEMAEVIGGEFWKPYAKQGRAAGATMFEARPPIDLGDARLRKLAAALGPAYMRVSGTWANAVYFADSDETSPATPPTGFEGVLTRREWAGVVDFAHAVNAGIVTSFAISAGVRDSAGLWTPDQARRFLAYTKSIGGDIEAAEFFNEPTFAAMEGAPPGYDAAAYARDFAVFRPFAKAMTPAMLIVGPGAVGEGVAFMPGARLATADLLAATPPPVFDVFSYHFYGAASLRCASLGGGVVGTTPGAALSEAWLSRTDQVNAFYEALRDRFEPGKPIWVTETADAACGGNPWASTFLDSFRYLDQLGRLARRGVSIVFHNTLASSDYGLIDQTTLTPRPNYWAALLWRRLMGPAVLDAGPSHPGLHLYAHCLHDHPGGVTFMAINTSRTRPQSIDLATAADRYTLTAQKLDSARVRLNGHELGVMADGELPSLPGRPIPPGHVELTPASITFLAVAEAANESCR